MLDHNSGGGGMCSLCSGGCANSCSGQCGQHCAGSCSGGCSSGCANNCGDACTGTCTQLCRHQCLMSCDNVCLGACGYSVCSGSCYKQCDGFSQEQLTLQEIILTDNIQQAINASKFLVKQYYQMLYPITTIPLTPSGGEHNSWSIIVGGVHGSGQGKQRRYGCFSFTMPTDAQQATAWRIVFQTSVCTAGISDQDGQGGILWAISDPNIDNERYTDGNWYFATDEGENVWYDADRGVETAYESSIGGRYAPWVSKGEHFYVKDQNNNNQLVGQYFHTFGKKANSSYNVATETISELKPGKTYNVYGFPRNSFSAAFYVYNAYIQVFGAKKNSGDSAQPVNYTITQYDELVKNNIGAFPTIISNLNKIGVTNSSLTNYNELIQNGIVYGPPSGTAPARFGQGLINTLNTKITEAKS